MENGVVLQRDRQIQSKGYSDLNVNGSSIFQSKIEFRLAKQPINGFINGDFRVETLNPSSEKQRNGTNARQKKTDGSEFLDTGLDPELCFGFNLRKIGAGLENLGNTCFLNSVLQCLTYTEPLAAYLQSGKHQNSCRIAGFCALCAIQKHVSRALQSSGRILAPKDLVSNLRCISRSFRNARQEDAHEYMVNLLESMHKCCLPSGVPSESPSAYEKSLVHKIFGGSLRSQVKCLQCSSCSNKFDPFLDMSLEIVKADSLYKALKNFTAPEHLDGGERQYNCQQCKQKVRATKQLTVHKAPYVLSIHLKRFRAYDPSQKIDKKVQFDPTLNLKPFVSGSYEGDLKYTLYGVLVHYGWSTHSGHYYCFVRTSAGTWYSLDDNMVVPVSEKTVLEQKAYMLFYVRDKSSFGPRKSMKVTQKENMKTNVSGNRTCSEMSHALKELSQNREKENKGKIIEYSSFQKDTFDIGLSRNGPLREALTSENNDLTMSQSGLAKGDPALHSSSKEQTVKDPLQCVSDLTSDDGRLLPSSTTPLIGNGSVPHNPENVNVENAREGEGFPENVGPQKSPDILAIKSRDCNDSQASEADKTPMDRTFQKSNTVTNQGASDKASSRDQETDNLEKTEVDKSQIKQISESTLVESVISGKAPSDSFSEDGGENEKGTVLETMESSNPSNMSNSFLDIKASSSACHRKPKKLSGGETLSMRLSSVTLLRSSVGIWQKKKHKRTKSHSTNTSNLFQKPSLDGNATVMGPSTSEETHTIVLNTTHSKRKKFKSPSKKEVIVERETEESTEEPQRDNIDKEARGRNSKTGAVLASGGPSQHNSCSRVASNHSDTRECNSSKDCRRDEAQNILMGMLTQGLEETVVARWDNIDFPTPASMESSDWEDTGIGYVAHEWDEEYDRGKRKKLWRSRHGLRLDGRNHFQEIANKKSQLKKAKKDQYGTGNTPFRI